MRRGTRAALISGAATAGGLGGASLGCAAGFMLAGPVGGAVLFACGLVGGTVSGAAACARRIDRLSERGEQERVGTS